MLHGEHITQLDRASEFIPEQNAFNYKKGLSRYEEMVLEIDNLINPYYFILAGFFTWLLLAGFLVSPSTYASVQQSNALDRSGAVGKSVISAVRNVPLIYIASFACLGATVGICWLWHRWRFNCVWVRRYVVV
jgi:hypothetical protein